MKKGNLLVIPVVGKWQLLTHDKCSVNQMFPVSLKLGESQKCKSARNKITILYNQPQSSKTQEIHERRFFNFRPPEKSIAFSLHWVNFLTWDFFPAKLEFQRDHLKLVSSFYLKRFACGNDLKLNLAKKVQIRNCSFHDF